MDDKKEIGKKIWELFSKNYTYGQIAKKLGISKSVVSNVINYSLPSKEWCNKNIKELKENWENEINELIDECQNDKKTLSTIFTLITSAVLILVNILLIMFINTHHIATPKDVSSILKYVGTIFAISVITGIIIFLISLFINNKIIKEYE